jgi:uncharacterized membrane protein HdeD (DUF308 family)
MAHVFISYSTLNRDYAHRLADKLRDEGFDVWIDNRNLHSSEDWWRSIVLALRSCAAFLVVLTPEADTSRWVQREITLADKYARPVYPLWLSGDLNSPNWEIFVRTQVEDVRGGKMPTSEFYDQLAQVASRQSRKGTNIVNQMDTSVSSADVSELAEDIASPPSPEVRTPLSTTRKIVSLGWLARLLRNCWLVAVRGAIAILFGLLTLSFPTMLLSSFILLFGVYATVDGLITIWWSIQRRTKQGWWIHLLEGAVSVIAGIVAFVYPDNTVSVMLNIIIIRVILIGIFEIWAAIQLRKEIAGGFWLGLSGVSSVLFGILGIILMSTPSAAILGIQPPTILGVYAIVFGLFLIMLALRLRSHATGTGTPTRSPA